MRWHVQVGCIKCAVHAFMRFETRTMPENYARESMKSIKDLRFRNFLVSERMLAVGLSSTFTGHSGSTRVGSRSLAPRATILLVPRVIRFCCRIGIGGADSGVGGLAKKPERDFGLKIVDARLSLFPEAKLEDPSSGAV